MISIEIIGTAFLMGLAGSLHCVGMCGPLAISLPLPRKNPFSKLVSTVMYNLGRVLTYSFLGAVIGLAYYHKISRKKSALDTK